MRDSFHVGTIRGIQIRVHYLLPLVIAFGLLVRPDLWAVLLFILPLIVLLHELGHSIVAQSFGIRVLDITFWPLGGMARMSQIPENSRIEGLIAIAGPAVNFVLAGASLTFLLLPGIAGSAVGDLALVFLLFNVALGGFNLIPAFPMDGGRVLRAILGRKGDWVRATEGAVRVGRFFALLMFLSFFVTWNPVLPLIALFVWWTGQQELLAVRLRHATAGFGPFGPFGAFGNFAGGPARPGPRPAGPFGAPAPSPPPPPSAAPREGSGWSEKDIAELESFHGRLRQFRPEE